METSIKNVIWHWEWHKDTNVSQNHPHKENKTWRMMASIFFLSLHKENNRHQSEATHCQLYYQHDSHPSEWWIKQSWEKKWHVIKKREKPFFVNKWNDNSQHTFNRISADDIEGPHGCIRRLITFTNRWMVMKAEEMIIHLTGGLDQHL